MKRYVSAGYEEVEYHVIQYSDKQKYVDGFGPFSHWSDADDFISRHPITSGFYDIDKYHFINGEFVCEENISTGLTGQR